MVDTTLLELRLDFSMLCTRMEIYGRETETPMHEVVKDFNMLLKEGKAIPCFICLKEEVNHVPRNND